MRFWRWILPLFLLGLRAAGCTAAPAVVAVLPSPTLAATLTLAPTHTRTPTPTATPAPATPSPSPTLAVCSPLASFALAALPEMVSNPYHPPQPGSDNPHQGVDLAVLDPSSRIALTGNTVQAVLPGQVVLILNDRFPYGSAVLIETPLDQAPADWWAPSGIPEPAPTLGPRSALTCPAFSQPLAMDETRRSVYVLYAHLQSIEGLSLGQPVTCGQALGTVGMSGNALNPHLHVEVRAAPAGIQLSSMAHYDTSASPDEMAAYCLWRVSGLFQLVDPLKFMLR